VFLYSLQARELPSYGYNKGAFLAAAHLLGNSEEEYQQAALSYMGNFQDSSPWHSKVRPTVKMTDGLTKGTSDRLESSLIMQWEEGRLKQTELMY